ncbi:MAG: methyltetrahydrofolate--corrinoid methyltransferase [Planctomycetota bacterium]|nr:MAG: methyltetrahydrofolate--corrinoid methyltransferase [Planctomycetota bacterium]
MIPIGERINGMFRDVKQAIAEKEKKVIQELALRQTEAGAKYLDVNVGTAARDQLGTMKWLVETIQEVCDTPLALDSQKLDVIKAGLEVAKQPVLINSCRADAETLDTYFGICKEHNSSLICLTMTKEGVSQDVPKRLEDAMRVIEKATEHEIPMERVFIDPIILPINVDQRQPKMICEVISQVKLMTDPPPHITCGLSNISQGTRNRHLINRTMLVMMVAAGMDSAICDVLDKDLMDAWITTELLMNRIIYSHDYIKAALTSLRAR